MTLEGDIKIRSKLRVHHQDTSYLMEIHGQCSNDLSKRSQSSPRGLNPQTNLIEKYRLLPTESRLLKLNHHMTFLNAVKTRGAVGYLVTLLYDQILQNIAHLFDKIVRLIVMLYYQLQTKNGK